MEVKLVNYSQSDGNYLIDSANVQEMIAFCARVSNPENQYSEKSEGLIKYLIKHKHWSPFEMVSACLEIKTTRDIARQILRHRSFSFQEFSQRYAVATEFVTREARLQDTKNRQNSIEIDTESDLHYEWQMKQQSVIDKAKEVYEWAIDNGIAKEQARVVLPEGNTKTRLYMNGSIRSWVHYIELRSANGTQKEHMDIAKACAKVISEVFPLAESLS